MTESAAAQSAPAAGQAGLSEIQRLTSVFLSPTKTFTDLKRKASWIVPWIVISIVSLAFVGVVAQKVGFEQATENQMRMNPKRAEKFDQMPADQKAKAMQISVTMTKVFSYGSPLVLLLFTVIIAGVLMATFNFGVGAEIPFALCLAVVMYASLPEIFRGLLAIVSLYAGADPSAFLFQNPVASNLGTFVDVTEHPALFALGSSIDIFKIWSLILTAIGFSCVSKVKRGTALSVVFGWYAVVTLIGVGFAAAFA